MSSCQLRSQYLGRLAVGGRVICTRIQRDFLLMRRIGSALPWRNYLFQKWPDGQPQGFTHVNRSERERQLMMSGRAGTNDYRLRRERATYSKGASGNRWIHGIMSSVSASMLGIEDKL